MTRKVSRVLTPQQYRALEAVTILLERGYSPTVYELGDEIGVGKTRAHQLVVDLRHAGYLRRVQKRSKYSISLSDAGSEKMARFCVERFKQKDGKNHEKI